MQPLAIIGAGGFVGASLVESLVLDGVPVRAVVRAYRNLAPLCRFGDAVGVRLADAENSRSLSAAIDGCATVVNLTTSTPAGIERSTKAILAACRAVGIGNLIHLSSAVVYGDQARPDTHDDSPPATGHWMPYAKAKSAAEVWLRKQMDDSPVAVTVLRPGLVWGPRSPHTLAIAQSLLRKDAYLVDGGEGVFNGIYIDNLIAAIRAASGHVPSPAGFYNVADAEVVTWRDFYTALAVPLACDVEELPGVSGRRFPWSLRAGIDFVQDLPLVNAAYHRLKSKLPDATKSWLKARLSGRVGYDRVAATYRRKPAVDRELWHLQRLRHKPNTDKFRQQFRFTLPLTFAEGIARTVAWLEHVGMTASTSPA